MFYAPQRIWRTGGDSPNVGGRYPKVLVIANPKLVLRVDRRRGERRMAGGWPCPKVPPELKPLRPLARLHMRHIPLVTTVD